MKTSKKSPLLVAAVKIRFRTHQSDTPLLHSFLHVCFFASHSDSTTQRIVLSASGPVAFEQARTSARRWFELLPQKRDRRQVEQAQHAEREAVKAQINFLEAASVYGERGDVNPCGDWLAVALFKGCFRSKLA